MINPRFFYVYLFSFFFSNTMKLLYCPSQYLNKNLKQILNILKTPYDNVFSISYHESDCFFFNLKDKNIKIEDYNIDALFIKLDIMEEVEEEILFLSPPSKDFSVLSTQQINDLIRINSLNIKDIERILSSPVILISNESSKTFIYKIYQLDKNNNKKPILLKIRFNITKKDISLSTVEKIKLPYGSRYQEFVQYIINIPENGYNNVNYIDFLRLPIFFLESLGNNNILFLYDYHKCNKNELSNGSQIFIFNFSNESFKMLKFFQYNICKNCFPVTK